MSMNNEKYLDKFDRQRRVAELKEQGVKHVTQYTSVEKVSECERDSNTGYITKRAVWVTNYHVCFPPQMATAAEVVHQIADVPEEVALTNAESEGLAVAAPESRAGEAMAELKALSATNTTVANT